MRSSKQAWLSHRWSGPERVVTLGARLLPALTLLAACAGTPAAAGQAAPVSEQTDELPRVNIYEVAPEQVARAQERGIIEVSGTASVEVPADRARTTFAVETRAASAGDAVTANAQAMEAVIAALRSTGIAGLEIETFGYTLRPEYRVGNNRTREIDGYTALNNVRVTVDDVDAVGVLIDIATAAGANRVAGLVFEASDTHAARVEALGMAVEKATQEARAIASALGRELGDPLEVRGGAQVPTPRFRPFTALAAEVAGRAAATPVEAGDQTVRATVTVTFALGPVRSGR